MATSIAEPRRIQALEIAKMMAREIVPSQVTQPSNGLLLISLFLVKGKR